MAGSQIVAALAMRTVAAGVVFASIVAVAEVAPAQTVGDPVLARAVAAYEAGDLRLAAARLDSVPVAAALAERAVVQLYRGLILYVEGAIDAARAAFVNALGADPGLRLDAQRHSPGRVGLFEAERQAFAARLLSEAGSAEAAGDAARARDLYRAAWDLRPEDAAAVAALQRLGLLVDVPVGAPPVARRGRSMAAALALGLVLPGAGEVYARRPLRGAAVFGLAAGAVAAGVLSERIETRCAAPPVAGGCPPADVVSEIRTRPYVVHGLIGAAVVSLAGAVDAALGVRAAGFRQAEGAVAVGPDGAVRVAWLRLVM